MEKRKRVKEFDSEQSGRFVGGNEIVTETCCWRVGICLISTNICRRVPMVVEGRCARLTGKRICESARWRAQLGRIEAVGLWALDELKTEQAADI